MQLYTCSWSSWEQRVQLMQWKYSTCFLSRSITKWNHCYFSIVFYWHLENIALNTNLSWKPKNIGCLKTVAVSAGVRVKWLAGWRCFWRKASLLALSSFQRLKVGFIHVHTEDQESTVWLVLVDWLDWCSCPLFQNYFRFQYLTVIEYYWVFCLIVCELCGHVSQQWNMRLKIRDKRNIRIDRNRFIPKGVLVSHEMQEYKVSMRIKSESNSINSCYL